LNEKDEFGGLANRLLFQANLNLLMEPCNILKISPKHSQEETFLLAIELFIFHKENRNLSTKN
jgi:hypothetical protein